MAEGVKGAVMARRLSLVVCALTRRAASRRTWRGLGGLATGVVVRAVVDWEEGERKTADEAS